MSPPVAAILVAAGQSRRFGGDKMWIDIWGRPVWRWGLDTLLSVPGMSLVAVVVPAEAIERFSAALPAEADDRVPGRGRRRGANGLGGGGHRRADRGRQIGEDTPVLVHDAARPAATAELMVRVVTAVRAGTGAVPLVPVHRLAEDRRPAGAVTGTVDREAVLAAQTPQGATLAQLRAAMEETHAWGRPVTDEAAAMASGGIAVQVGGR